MKLLKDLFIFLTKRDVLTVAIGLIVSNAILGLTKSFTDDLVLPLLDPVMKKLGGEKLGDVELKLLGARVKIGKFIQTLIRALVLLMTVLLGRRLLKL